MNTTGKILALTKDHELWRMVLDLDQAYFPRPWKDSDWNSLDLSRHQVWAYHDGDHLLGFTLLATNPGDETAHLLKIFIHSELRGTKTSQIFWQYVAESLRNLNFKYVYLEVEESNERARRFYEKIGFQVLRRVKSYYSDGEAAEMLRLTI